MDDIIRQLKALKTSGQMNPDRVWVVQTREKLLTHIRTERVEKPAESLYVRFTHKVESISHIFVPERLFVVFRPLITTFLVGSTAVGGWITTVSASYSVPGDVLYNVKLAAEQTQVAVATVAGSDEWQAQLHLRFATERAREAKEVVAKNEPESAEQLSDAMQSLQKSIVAASDSIKDVSNEQPEKAVALVKDANEKTGEIVSTLNQVSKDVSATGDALLSKEVVETTKVVNDAGIKAVEAVVQKQSTGEGSITSAEVKTLVSEKINTILADSKSLGDVTSTIASTLASNLAASTTPVTSSSTAQRQIVEQSVQKVTETTAVVQGAIEEAKTLVDGNHLLEALQKTKEANNAAQEVKQVVVEAQKAASDLLPPPTAPAGTSSTTAAITPPALTTSTVPIAVSSSTTVASSSTNKPR